MILMLHIFIAITSLIFATYSLFKPSWGGLVRLYIFIGATLVSGMLLVVLEPAKMMHVCTAGITYLAIVGVMAIAVRRQLKHAEGGEIAS